MTNLEDIDCIQATLSPVDDMLLADLTVTHVDSVHNGILISESNVCINDCPKESDRLPEAEMILVSYGDSLLNPADSLGPLPSDVLESWSDGKANVITAAVHSADPGFMNSSSAAITLLEHTIPDLVNNVLAIPDMQQELADAADIITDVLALPVDQPMSSVTATQLSGDAALPASAAPMTSLTLCCDAVTAVSHSVDTLLLPLVPDLHESDSSLDLTGNLAASNSETTLTNPFDGMINSSSSFELSFNESAIPESLPSLTVADSAALVDSMTSADLEAVDLQEFIKSTRVNRDIMLAASDGSQSVSALSDEPVAMDTLEELHLIDLDQVEVTHQQRESGLVDENFEFDESDWTCVQVNNN